jgi:hypothetical protein
MYKSIFNIFMTNTTKTKKITKPAKYIRLLIDSKTQLCIDEVKRENPLFSDADVLYYTLGKYVVTDKGYVKKPDDIFERIRFLNKDEPELSEDEIFQILKDNDLM